jgi:hypothetical protein
MTDDLNTIENAPSNSDDDMRALRDGELDAVAGGHGTTRPPPLPIIIANLPKAPTAADL